MRIYKATNRVNGKVYVGKTTNPLTSRIAEHNYNAKTRRDTTHFHLALRKYGNDQFLWEEIESNAEWTHEDLSNKGKNVGKKEVS